MLVEQSGELPSSEFSVMICPIRINIFLQQFFECSSADSLSAVTSNGEFSIEEVPVGRYGIKLNPAESGLITLQMLTDSAGEDLIFEIEDGQDVDLGQIRISD